VILFEDLHWVDGATEAYVENLVDRVAGSRTLLLVNFRPEYRAPWVNRPEYRQVLLEPLGPAALSELLEDLLGGDASLDGLPERIRSRTGGNPFFVEEVVQSLAEAGLLEGSRGAYRLARPIEEVTIPPTVQSLLASRIDRLSEPEKTLLQVAAVIGKELPEPVLMRVAELPADDLRRLVDALVAAGFLKLDSVHPECVYAFRHPLTQEVAYRSQLSERRARVHGAVARTILELYPDRLDERAALLSHHWECAGDALEAGRWGARAAEWVGLSNVAESTRHWRKVRSLLATVAETPETLELTVWSAVRLLNFGWRTGMTDAEASALFDEGAAVARRAGHVVGLSALRNVYGAVRGLAGDLEGALAHVLESVRLGDEAGDLELRVGLRVALVQLRFMQGDLRVALALADEALALTGGDRRVGSTAAGFSPYVYFLAARGFFLVHLGRIAEGRQDLDRAVEIARGLGETEILGMVRGFSIDCAALCEPIERTLVYAGEAVDIAERIGSPFSRVWAYRDLGLAHNLNGQWGAAANALEQALAILHDRRTALHAEALILTDLALALARRGDCDRAVEHATRAVALATGRHARLMEAYARLTLAECLRRQRGLQEHEQIGRELVRVDALCEETGDRLIPIQAEIERADLAGLAGRAADRRAHLEEARRRFAELGATARAEAVDAELSRLEPVDSAPVSD
jgi:adenylate cyclase